MDDAAPKRQWTQWVMALAGVSMIAAAGWIVVGRRAPAPTAAATPPRAPSGRVSLYAQHDGPVLRLHWNGDSDAIRRAASGALVITDGPRRSRLELDPADLRGGAASYWPESTGVTFRLELDGAVAGELQAPALAVREEEPRPSPFEPRPKKAKAPRRAVAVEEPGEETPKPHTVRAADAAPRHEADRERKADREDADAPKPSKWRRVTGKIPLLRRLNH